MATDPIRGKTITWSYDDGPMAGKSFEHTFGNDGIVTWRGTDGQEPSNSKTGKPETDQAK